MAISAEHYRSEFHWRYCVTYESQH